MDLSTRTRRNLAPMVGGITAVATATGAFAAVAQVAPAGAEADSANPTLGAAGLAGAGTFESCDAYFGYGKEEEFAALGIVDFDVVDINGDDGVAHDVDADTNVRLVMENEEGDLLECVPLEVTEEEWDDFFGGGPEILPEYPGPGHYVYPTVAFFPEIPDFGEVVAVGFRVTTIPGEHTLVDPTGVQDLTDSFIDIEELIDGEAIDQRVLDFITTEEGAAAATALEEALADCDAEEPIDGTDEDLLAGLQAILDLLEADEEITDADCDDVEQLHAIGSFIFALVETTDYTEEIQLSLPEEPAAEPPAALPADAAPDFTG